MQVGEFMWMTPEQDKLSAALLAFSQDFKDPAKDAQNPHFRSKFVPLGGAIEAIRPAARKHGLFISQPPGGRGVYTIWRHQSGQMQITWSEVPLEKQTPQGLGSALTYSRRYAMMGAAGGEGDVDDDAEAATHRDDEPRSEVSKAPVPEDGQVAMFATMIGSATSMDELKEVWHEINEAHMVPFKVSMLEALKDTAKERLTK
jgi:hypothetical protein